MDSHPTPVSSPSPNNGDFGEAFPASRKVYVEGRRVSMFSLRSLVRNKVNVRPGLGVVLVADKSTPTDYVVRAMDEIQLGGVERVALAARQENP